MKFHLLLLMLCICATFYGQTPQTSDALPSYYLDYTNVEMPSSPKSQNFETYGNIPVDPSTGIPNINIPIYTLTIDGVSLPISLSYHASGVKVDELSSSVGLKWTLNAGGSISRTVKSKADEVGWLTNGFSSIDDSFFNQDPGTSSYAYWANQKAENQDHNPDEFSFNILNYSGNFILKKDQTPLQKIKSTITVNPDIAYVAANLYTINSFDLADNKGNTFRFGKDFNTSNPNHNNYREIGDNQVNIGTTNYGNNPNPQSITGYTFDPNRVTWLLSEIETKNGNLIQFEYVDYDLNYELNGVAHNLTAMTSCADGPQGYPVVNASFNTTTTNYNYDMKLIERIFTDTEEIVFTYDNHSVATHWKKKLVQIEVRELSSGVANTVKKFIFDYDVYSSTVNEPRLKLVQVQEVGSKGVVKPPYIFDYNDTPLPSKNSYSKDFFGYYNGASNSSLIPDHVSVETFLNSFSLNNVYTNHVDGNSREPDTSINGTYIKAGILEKITYPTGGTTEFLYELNSEGEIYSGGLRIKEIYDKDGGSQKYNRKTFKYTGLNGMDLERDFHLTKKYIGNDGITFHSNFVATPDLVRQGHFYDMVEVFSYDGSNSIKTIYNYSLNSIQGSFKSLIREEQFFEGNNLRKLVEYDYESVGNLVSVNWNTLSEQMCINPDNTLNFILGYGDNPNGNQGTHSVNHYYGNTKKEISRIITTSLFGTTYSKKAVTNITSSEYDSMTLNVIKEITDSRYSRSLDSNGEPLYAGTNNDEPVIAMQNPEGDLIEIDYTYPYDYSDPATQGLPEGLIISKLVDSQNYGGIIYGQYFEYDSHGNIKNVFHYNKGAGSNTSTVGYIPSDYELIASIKFENHNIVEVKKENNLYVSYIYGYNEKYPVAKIENIEYNLLPQTLVSQIKTTTNESNLLALLNQLRNHSTTTNALVTTYTYKPLIGVKTITSPNGDTQFYEYDTFGRLLLVKDNLGNILQENEYNYHQ